MGHAEGVGVVFFHAEALRRRGVDVWVWVGWLTQRRRDAERVGLGFSHAEAQGRGGSWQMTDGS